MSSSNLDFEPLLGLSQGTLSDTALNSELEAAWPQIAKSDPKLSNVKNPFNIVPCAALTGTKKHAFFIAISIKFLKYLEINFSMKKEEVIDFAKQIATRSLENMSEKLPDENVGDTIDIQGDKIVF